MSELNEKQPQQPQQSNRLMEIPEYINVDALRREEFLSQVGSFSSEHRKIFQLLCEHWQPGISYKRFISQVKGVKFAEKDLIGLLTRLKTAKCGLLKHKCISGILEKRIIILTDKGEKSFYYHFLEDEIEVSMQSSLHPMVKSSKLLDDNIEIPDSFIEVLTPRHITRSFFKQCINDERIFSIPTSEDDSIMATSGTISSIISMSIRRIRDSLKNSNVLAIVAKIQAKTIMDLKRDLLLNDPTYWRKLTIAILDAKDEILQASRSLNKDFFKANELIRFFSENEIKALEKKRAEELEMFNEMKTIA
ncbi:MAG: hypothetical protein GY760_28325, partial [Deltaproteobacteria bacterium]|nr:hypothetical protein [Deltaproteobacteria bacterium]